MRKLSEDANKLDHFLVFQVEKKKRFKEELISILCFAIVQMNNKMYYFPRVFL